MADETKATDAGQRYAQSLFELTIENGSLQKVEADLKSLKAMVGDSADLRRLIASPAFSAEDKGKGLSAVAKKAGFQPLTIKFLGLVAANGRAGDLMGAITAFTELSAKHRGVVTAEVVSAAALSPAQLKGVQAALAEALGNLADLLRQRQRMKLKIKAISSEAKASAMIIGALPFMMLGLLSFMSPDYVMPLFTDPRGHMMLGAGLGSISLGAFVMWRMTQFEI